MHYSKLAVQLLMTVAGFMAVPQANGQAQSGNVSQTINDLSGEGMYRIYCASCHGIDGKGSGPAGAALKKAVPDLTQISARNNGQFPDFRVTHIIDGYEVQAAHGSHDMPVWGVTFAAFFHQNGNGRCQVDAMSRYITALLVLSAAVHAATPAADSVRGAQVFQAQHCIECRALLRYSA